MQEFSRIHNVCVQAAAIVDHLCQQKTDSKFLGEDVGKTQEKNSLAKLSIGQIEPMDVDSANVENKIKKEKEELDLQQQQQGKNNYIDDKRPKKHLASDDPSTAVGSTESQPPAKLFKGSRYKTYTTGAAVIHPAVKYKRPTDREITEVWWSIIRDNCLGNADQSKNLTI